MSFQVSQGQGNGTLNKLHHKIEVSGLSCEILSMHNSKYKKSDHRNSRELLMNLLARGHDRPEGRLELLISQLPHHGVQLLLLLLAWRDKSVDTQTLIVTSQC